MATTNNNVLDRFTLKGKVVLLTGGAGIYGSGLTADLAGAGAKLIIAARNLEKLEEVAAGERKKGNDVVAEQYDQGSEDSIKELLKKTLDRCGRIDGLVNNSVARPMGPNKPVGETFAESMRINATGVFLMHHYFGYQMAQQGGGSIVNIGSMQGMIGPDPHLYKGTDMVPVTVAPDYFFHKGGMINLTRFFASMLGEKDVRVNCLSPGGFYTNQPEPFLSRYKNSTFLNRMGDEKDLGGVVIFFLSEASRYITGTNLPVDGGYTAK